MASYRGLFSVFLSILVASAPLACQTSQGVAAAYQHRIPPPVDLAKSVPFSLNPIPGEHFSIRSADQMSPVDKDLLASAHSAIHEAAHNLDLEYNKPAWTTEQIDCPAFPNHLLVRFSRTHGKSDVSVLMVAIPRAASGTVRIIPVLRSGYSLFTPAARNKLTIATFNHIRADHEGTGKPNWVDVARCYIALAGSDPDIPQQAPAAAPGGVSTAGEPILEVAENHQVIIRYETLWPSPTQWKMVFNKQGKLLAVATSHLHVPSVRPVTTQSRERSHARPVPDTF